MDLVWGALASLIGVVVGGVLQHVTSQRALNRQHEWERSRLIQEKLELVSEVAEDLCSSLKNTYLNAIVSVEAGKPVELVGVLPFAKLEMLLGFYAPELRPHYERLLVLRDKMSKILVDVASGRIPVNKEDKQAFNDDFIKAVFEVSKIFDALTVDACKLGRKQLHMKES